VRAGQWSGLVILLGSIAIALYFSTLKASFLFVLIQNVFAYIAPPFAVIFTLGILWRRATATAAMTTICLGFPFTLLLQYVLFERVAWLHPYSNYLHRALISWVFCMIVMIATSLVTPAPPREKVDGIIWTPRYALLPQKLQAMYSGVKDFRLWWLIFVSLVLVIYAFFLWFRFQHPENP
jgi:SSS family solute:Na+ symporter